MARGFRGRCRTLQHAGFIPWGSTADLAAGANATTMKRTPETSRAELPAFLDAAETATAAEVETPTSDLTDSSTETDAASLATASPDEAPPPPADGLPTEDTQPSDELGAVPAAAALPPTRASAFVQKHQRKASSGQGGGLFLGAGVVMAAFAFAMPWLPTDAVGALTNLGFGPQGLFVCGMVLAGAGASLRRTARLQQNLDAAEERRRAEAETLNQNLHGLLSARTSGDEPAANAGQDLQYILLALQRQDEKLNNLTKAFKMYGKPLMEIANQGTDLAGVVSTVKNLVEANGESSRQALLRMEAQLKSPAGKQELADLQNNMLQMVKKVDALAANAPSVAVAPLQQQVGRLEVAVAAIAQRLEDSEVRKSLLRLEEKAQKDRETLQELLRGERVQKVGAELQEKLERATRGLTDGISQLREGNLGGLENAVRDIQREVAGVATTVAQINAAVKNGARTPVAAPATAPAPTAPAASPASTASSAEKPAAGPAAAPAAEKPAGEAGGYQTGSRSSGGKNVLGAIAKLKQMKG